MSGKVVKKQEKKIASYSHPVSIKVVKKQEKKIAAYCIAFSGHLCIRYIRPTKSEAILALRLDDSDRMSWEWHKKNNNASCVKVLVEKA